MIKVNYLTSFQSNSRFANFVNAAIFVSAREKQLRVDHSASVAFSIRFRVKPYCAVGLRSTSKIDDFKKASWIYQSDFISITLLFPIDVIIQ